MKKQVLNILVALTLAAMVLSMAGCGGGNNGSESDTGEIKEEAPGTSGSKGDAETASSSATASDKESKSGNHAAMEAESGGNTDDVPTAEECAAKSDVLRAGDPVKPDDPKLLSDMAELVTFACILDEQGVIFSEMDSGSKTRLQYQIQKNLLWHESKLYGAIPIESGTGPSHDGLAVSISDAAALFKDVYGDQDRIRKRGGCRGRHGRLRI